MAKQPKPKPDDPEQSKRFEETARQVEADESGKSFERAIEIVAPVKSKQGLQRPRNNDQS